MTTVDATAIVVTHNSVSQVQDCLSALLSAGLPVRLIDNASTDGTPALVGARFPAVDLLVNDENVGFARAVNQGLAGVRTGSVLLVNPDCVLPPATARGLVEALRDRPEVGVVAPRLIARDGRVAVSAHPFESLTSVLGCQFGAALLPVPVRKLFSGRSRRRAYDACLRPGEPRTVDWVSGACLAVRTDLLLDLGGLDEGYFMYYEDEELCLRAWRRNAAVLYLPTVSATHVGGASSSPGQTWPHLYASRLRFFARHRPSTFGPVRLAVLLRALLGTALALARGLLRPGPAARRRVRAWREIYRIAAAADRTTLSQPVPMTSRSPSCT
ncbi:glycosyltransferase family 2 protein [Plantactinospora siamensis]|uniref:Glycosyltransferase family 2 protein n=1 Tax=Plantactinospora siamensis TaxID=555372 RepID=A0ABV6P4B8_9ACTN